MYTVTERDRGYLRRCVELAREAAEAGDQPFGSVLVDAGGNVLFEDRNRTGSGDATRHPEFAIARWAAEHVPAEQRGSCIVYTSGEHCAMCSAAHAMVGLGRIVYATSSEQLRAWRREWGVEAPVRMTPLAINAVAPDVPVAGPDWSLADEMRAIHATRLGVDGQG